MENRVTRMIGATAAVALVAVLGVIALGLVVDWALAVVITIVIVGLPCVVPIESILYDERQPRGRPHGWGVEWQQGSRTEVPIGGTARG